MSNFIKNLVGLASSLLLIALIRLAQLLEASCLPARNQHAREIVLLRLDHIGDLILTSALLRELRSCFSDSHITLVVSNGNTELAQECPYVNEVLTVPSPKGPRILANISSFPSALKFARKHFSERSIDLVISPRWGPDLYGATTINALIAAKEKIWFSSLSSRSKSFQNFGFDRFYTRSLVSKTELHEVPRSFEILEALGHVPIRSDLELWIGQADLDFARRVLQDSKSRRRFLVALAVGANAAKRKWPVERFLEVSRSLKKSHDALFLLVGSALDEPVIGYLANELGESVIFRETVSLPRISAIIAGCSLFVGNDSGPMHIAAAAGVPVVAISCHPTNADSLHHNSPLRFSPWSTQFRVVQPGLPRWPCRFGCESQKPHCILNVSSQEVLRATASLLADFAPRAKAGT